MVRDVRGPEWPFMWFQNSDWVVKSYSHFWTIPKLIEGCLCVALCVDMLFL